MAVYRPRCRASVRFVLDELGSGTDKAVWVEGIVPISATVHSNPPKEPDEFDLEIDAKRCPVHAHQIRAASVSIYMWDSDGSDGDEERLTPDRLQITGLCDEPETNTQDGTTPTIRLVGKDYTMALARAWDQRKRIPVGRDVVTTVQSMVDEATRYFPPTGGPLSVQVARGVLSALDIATSNQRLTVVWKGKGAPPIVQGSGANGLGYPAEGDDSTVWEVIRWLCAQHGLTVQVRDLEVWIQGEHEIDPSRIRSLAIGRNVRSLRMSRGLGRQQVPQIIVRGGVNPVTKQKVEGRWPPTANPGQEPVVEPFYGVYDPVRLQEIAKRAYFFRGRHEAKAMATTTHLRDLDGLDLTGMRSGDAVRLEVEAPSERAMEAMSVPQRARYMVGLGYHPKAAEAIAENYELLRLSRHPFKVKNVTKNWHHRSAPSFDFDLNEFIFVERDNAA